MVDVAGIVLLAEVEMVEMEVTANKVLAETAVMEATVLAEEEKGALVAADVKETGQMETMETRDNQDKRI
jgi:hypothetical protein